MDTNANRVLRTALVLGLVCLVGAVGAFSAFSSQTDNPGNVVAVGTVVLADNDAGSSLYNISNAKPGDSQTSCIRVVYTGSLDADVKLYTPSTIGALGPYVNLKIEPGSQSSPSFPSCSGFSADEGGALFNGPLSTFPTSYAGGIADYPGAGSKWANGNAVVYRVTASVSASLPDEDQGATTGSHTIRWEAQSQ
jgi:predicted ribosomally synthesized peptide with SipW-like signal peptide